MIPQGTIVTVKTTNGGQLTAALLETYRPTYGAVVERHGSYLILPAWRIASVEVAA